MNSNNTANSNYKSGEKSCLKYLLSLFCCDTPDSIPPTDDELKNPKDIKLTPEEFWCGKDLYKMGTLRPDDNNGTAEPIIEKG
jgi:hypothetical protein